MVFRSPFPVAVGRGFLRDRSKVGFDADMSSLGTVGDGRLVAIRWM